MSISGISASVGSTQSQLQVQRPGGVDQSAQTGGAARPSFAERMGAAVDQVARQQESATDAAKAFETGQTDDLAGVMVEQQVASLGFQMTMQVRNKALTAYRDIMNMPV